MTALFPSTKEMRWDVFCRNGTMLYLCRRILVELGPAGVIGKDECGIFREFSSVDEAKQFYEDREKRKEAKK